MFLGQHSHSLDDKGRISLPAPFRKVVQGLGSDRVILTRGIGPCLLGFTVEAWQKLVDKLTMEPMLDREVEAFERIYAAHACETPVDRQGRVLIPPFLRNYAAIEKDVLFAGRIRKFEIWQPGRWDDAVQESTALLSDGGRLNAII
ncbi:MAG: division/cell wall cluster transcriptional repressor MraZ [Magnetococcales bacterium]|nr:division/cell wall cluster transcriptional repressor MraZ [Magnetococcales bacterium]